MSERDEPELKDLEVVLSVNLREYNRAVARVEEQAALIVAIPRVAEAMRRFQEAQEKFAQMMSSGATRGAIEKLAEALGTGDTRK